MLLIKMGVSFFYSQVLKSEVSYFKEEVVLLLHCIIAGWSYIMSYGIKNMVERMYFGILTNSQLAIL